MIFELKNLGGLVLGESFIFKCCPRFEVFKWTQANECFALAEDSCIAFGSGMLCLLLGLSTVTVHVHTTTDLENNQWNRHTIGICQFLLVARVCVCVIGGGFGLWMDADLE